MAREMNPDSIAPSTPIVSVIMAVYNGVDYLPEAIDSILAQTFPSFEFIILDDCSTDPAVDAMLQQYAHRDRRIRLVKNDQNLGLTKSLNRLIQIAKGEFLARMDADDIALPDRFRLQVEFLQQHPEVVCVGGAHTLIDHKGRLLTHLQLPLTDADIQREALAGHGSICHPCAMLRRSAVLTVNGYNETLEAAQDLDLWLRLGEVGQLANLPETLLQYRLHLQSVSETKGQLQRQRAREACERAWERRGIQGKFEATELWRPSSDRASRHRFMLQYGWWAFNSRQRRTALIYALKALWAMPYQRSGWILLLCALLKPLPQPSV